MEEEKKVETPTEILEEKNEVKEEPKKEKKKSKKKVICLVVCLLVVILTVVLFIVFYKPETKQVKNTSKEVNSKYAMTGNDLQDFDLAFLKLELADNNMVYSPLSIKYTLAMLSEGSKGDSKAQIDAVIGDYKSKKYENGNNMSFANAFFIRNSMKDAFVEDYQKNLQEKYNAEVVFDEFTSPDNINNWVSNKTFKLINNLVDNVEDIDFALINALAIDMEWKNKIQATSDQHEKAYSVSYAHEKYYDYIIEVSENKFDTLKFNGNYNAKAAEIGASLNNYDIVKTLGEGNIRKTVSEEYDKWEKETGGCGNSKEETINNYMKELKSNYKKVDVSTDFKYYIDEDVKVFNKELKEYNGTTLEYIAIMPMRVELNEFVKSSTAESLNGIINKLKEVKLENTTEGKVTKIVGGIPFFKYETELKYIEDLKQLGIKDIFTKDADLSGIVKGGGYSIDKAAHKANIEFSNDGIKASAATFMGGYGAASCEFEYLYDVPVEIIDMSFNSPYLYIIRDKDTKEVWFTGAVKQPIENDNTGADIIDQRPMNYN